MISNRDGGIDQVELPIVLLDVERSFSAEEISATAADEYGLGIVHFIDNTTRTGIDKI